MLSELTWASLSENTFIWNTVGTLVLIQLSLFFRNEINSYELIQLLTSKIKLTKFKFILFEIKLIWITFEAFRSVIYKSKL